MALNKTKTYKCIIFDCDGVLVDSEPISNQVMVDLANSYGANIDLDYAYNNFKQTAKIKYTEWNSGNNLVFVEFIAIKNVRKIFKWCINMANKFKGIKDYFTWLRVEDNQIKRMIVKDI